jgi:hypothetical protein
MPKFSNTARAVAAIIFVAAAAEAQWTAHFPDALTTGVSNTQPFSQATFSQFIQYPGTAASPSGGATTSLAAQGVAPGARLTELAMVPITAGPGVYAANNALVMVGHVVGASSSTQWAANLVGPVTLWDSTIDGPLTFAWTGGTWTPYISNPTGIFQWDGVNDVGIYICLQTAGATTNNFSVTTPSPAIYIRHGYSTGFNPAPGTGSTTTGILGMRQRMKFDPGFTLNAVTSGGGVGDLTIFALGDIPAGTTEGFTLVTADTTGSIGSGPAFGIHLDALTIDVLYQPAFVGNPLHWVTPSAPFYPEGNLVVNPGLLSFLAGQSWRMVAVAFSPGFVYLGRTNVVQLDW